MALRSTYKTLLFLFVLVLMLGVSSGCDRTPPREKALRGVWKLVLDGKYRDPEGFWAWS